MQIAGRFLSDCPGITCRFFAARRKPSSVNKPVGLCLSARIETRNLFQDSSFRNPNHPENEWCFGMIFRMLWCPILWLLAAIASSATAAEIPQLNFLFPAGGQVGTSVEVVAHGKFPSWPVKVWTDDPEIHWVCQTESGKLRAEISERAKLGLHWVRLVDAAGATAVRPFLVGASTTQVEQEPNNHIAEANVVDKIPAALFGVLDKTADVDLISIELEEHQWLVATLDSANWLKSPADASLQILDSRGFVVTENLDHVGLDPYVQYQAPVAGSYFVRVFAFPATPNSTVAFSGGSDWIYRLRLDREPQPFSTALTPGLQSELSAPQQVIAAGKHATQDDAYAVQLPAKLAGVISQAKETHYVRFTAAAGQTYQARVLARQFGSALDATLSIHDASGKQLAQVDDVSQDRDPLLTWKAPAAGEVTLAIRDFHRQGGSQYRYLLRLQELSPDFSLSVSSDLLAGKSGEVLEVSVNITRELGYAADIEVALGDIPDDISCPVAVSKLGSETEKKVTLKLKAGAAFQGPIAIEAHPTGEAAQQRLAQAPEGKPIWLSISPKS